MNAEILMKHFDRISEAPDAVARLRRFILDLAVRGKLVEQDPDDEPASGLLMQIQAEQARLVKEKKIKKHSALSSVGDDEAPFILPKSWRWCRLGDVGDWGAGSTPPRGHSEYYGDDIPWLKSGELGDSLALRGSEERVSGLALEKCSFRLNKPGDVLIAMYGATIGKLAILAEPAVTNQAVCGCTPFKGVFNKYLFIFLLSRRVDFHGQSEGGAQPNISKVKIVSSYFALPPLAEQHRIVAKVDELMALCDQLEAARNEREAQRDRLVAASLHRIGTARVGEGEGQKDDETATTLPAAACFHLDHLPRLTTRVEHIKQLRQAILNLAVRGRLVPQDPNDEPTAELFALIREDQQQSIALGRIKIRVLSMPCVEAPQTNSAHHPWPLVRLADLITFGPQNGVSPKEVKSEKFPKALTLTATTSGHFNPAYYKHIELTERACENYWLSSGDLLFQRGNTPEYVGMAAIYDGPEKSFVFPDLMIRVRLSRFISLRFAHIVLISPLLRSYFSNNATGASKTMPKINQETLLNAPIPLPPLSEQHRIVAKVDELMALCDQLEAQLTTTETDSRRLLEAVLNEALQPAKEMTL